MAVKSITGSTAHGTKSEFQNPDRRYLLGNIRNTPLISASNWLDLDNKLNRNHETRIDEGFEDGVFPALKPKNDPREHAHHSNFAENKLIHNNLAKKNQNEMSMEFFKDFRGVYLQETGPIERRCVHKKRNFCLFLWFFQIFCIVQKNSLVFFSIHHSPLCLARIWYGEVPDESPPLGRLWQMCPYKLREQWRLKVGSEFREV